MASQALGRTQSPLAMFYRRVKSRIGGKGAITATAHKLAYLVSTACSSTAGRRKQSMQEYEQKVRQQQERSLRRKATASWGMTWYRRRERSLSRCWTKWLCVIVQQGAG